MGTLALMVAGGIFWSCQKDEVINDALMLKGGSLPFTWVDVCANGTNDLVLTLAGTGTMQIQKEIAPGVWENIGSTSGTNTLPLVVTIADVAAGTYYFRYKVGSGGFSAPVEIVIESCCTTALSGVTECGEFVVNDVTYNRKAVYTFSTEDGGGFKIQGGLTNFTGDTYLVMTSVGTFDSWIPGNSSNRIVKAEGSLSGCGEVVVTVYWNSTNEDVDITGAWSVELDGVKILVIDPMTCDDEKVGEEPVE